MSHHRCDVCSSSGQMGNKLRVYVLTSPTKTELKTLCWPCYLKAEQQIKKQPHHAIRDKVHSGERT